MTVWDEGEVVEGGGFRAGAGAGSASPGDRGRQMDKQELSLCSGVTVASVWRAEKAEVPENPAVTTWAAGLREVCISSLRCC